MNPIAAIVDQAWLSLVNFSVAFIFIWGAEKIEYGNYILLTTPLLLIQSIQNALINSPLATILPTAKSTAHLELKNTAISIHVILGLLSALLGSIGLLIYHQAGGIDADSFLITGFTLAIMGTIAREAQRAFAYANQEGIRALFSDMVYGILVLIALYAVILENLLTAAAVLAVTGCAGLLTLLIRIGSFQKFSFDIESARQLWSCSRWALPSVLATWITLSSYPYFAGTYLGIAAVAEIAAARLFLMPVALITTAWGNWYRPKISEWFSKNDIKSIKHITGLSLKVGGLITICIVFFLFLIYPSIEPVIGPQYQGLHGIILAWLIYFSFAFARSIFMATLMVDANGYRILNHITWIALAFAIPNFIFFSANGPIWIVSILCIIEFIQLIIITIKAKRYWGKIHNRRP